jgi:formylglycine-generating enzyme required for sulfatase activity
VREARYKTDAETDGRGSIGRVGLTMKFEQSPIYTWQNPSFTQTDADPVVNVSWNDAVKFCEWLSQKEKKTYGLPTEAQWEYACRASTTTAYSFGDDSQMLGDYAWYKDNSKIGTHPVGGKQPNPWGLFDMHGNVVQWCADYYDAKFYQKSPNKDPENITENRARICRGGSWYDEKASCRAAHRGGDLPNGRNYYTGFRVCFRPD